MTFFSRCETPQRSEPSRRLAVPSRGRAAPGRVRQALSDFREDVGILFRYAAGLDYYGRDQVKMPR